MRWQYWHLDLRAPWFITPVLSLLGGLQFQDADYSIVTISLDLRPQLKPRAEDGGRGARAECSQRGRPGSAPSRSRCRRRSSQRSRHL
eukprot:scaffold60897_cov36-Phaeocystis_antarctica.AAC.1